MESLLHFTFNSFFDHPSNAVDRDLVNNEYAKSALVLVWCPAN